MRGVLLLGLLCVAGPAFGQDSGLSGQPLSFSLEPGDGLSGDGPKRSAYARWLEAGRPPVEVTAAPASTAPAKTEVVAQRRADGANGLLAHHLVGEARTSGTYDLGQALARTEVHEDIRQSEFGNCWFLSTLAASAHAGRITPAFLSAQGFDATQTYAPTANGANWVNFLAEKHGTNRERGGYVENAFQTLFGRKPVKAEFSVKNIMQVIRLAKAADTKPTVVARNGVIGRAGHAMAVVGYDRTRFPGKLLVYDQARKAIHTIDLGVGNEYGMLDRIYQLP